MSPEKSDDPASEESEPEGDQEEPIAIELPHEKGGSDDPASEESEPKGDLEEPIAIELPHEKGDENAQPG